MFRIKQWRSDPSTRSFAVRCDSKGLTGCWSCENLGPVSHDRDDAGNIAKAVGWIVAHSKWYCPECQRDGFVPKPATRSH